MKEKLNKKRRVYGEHITPIRIFKEFILPEIRNYLYDYVWVDLFAGNGNLILPILDLIPDNQRIDFFKKHIFLFDVQKEMVDNSIKNAVEYNIPKEIAEENIIQMNTIERYPKLLLNLDRPVYHITNPPYLYIGYISKNKETSSYLKYFEGKNCGYQDLYQIGLMNDLRNKIKRMIYIIPSNFLFGFSSSNKIRDDFLKYYRITKSIIFEKEIFEYTGTNVIICFFERKTEPKNEIVSFKGIKINNEIRERLYNLHPDNHYRAGSDFEEFVNNYKADKALKINYYLMYETVEKNKGDFRFSVINANDFNGKEYNKVDIYVNERLYNKIKFNILFIRTVDTGSRDGRLGIYKIKDVYGSDGILVTKERYRTHPIQIFIDPMISLDEQDILSNYFNLVLEKFREETDSEFMTTYKYSDSKYTRKYLGLSQARKLIETFPWIGLTEIEKTKFKNIIASKDAKAVISFVKKKNTKFNLDYNYEEQ